MKLKKEVKKEIRRLDIIDMSLIKLAVIAFIFFAITKWPITFSFIQNVNPWYYLIAFVLLMIRPIYRMWIKNTNSTERPGQFCD